MTTILITRPEPENQRTANKMAALGLRPVLMPFLNFRSLAVDLPPPERFQDKWTRLSVSKTRSNQPVGVRQNKDLEPGFVSTKTQEAPERFQNKWIPDGLAPAGWLSGSGGALPKKVGAGFLLRQRDHQITRSNQPVGVRQNKDLEPGFDSIKTEKALDEFAALALTSTNALRALKEQDYLAKLLHLPVFTVGKKTAEAARNAGFSSVMAANNSLASLVECIKTARPPGPIFYPAARHRAGDLAQMLNAGVPDGEAIEVGTFAIYQMQAKSTLSVAEKKLLNSGELEAAVFYSARTAAAFANICRKHQLRLSDRLSVLCLSENVAIPLQQVGFVIPLIAEAPNEEAMLALALSFSSMARK